MPGPVRPVEAAAHEVRDQVAVRAGEGGLASPAPASSCHAVQAHQAAHPLLVDRDAGTAQLDVHPRHPVVPVGGIEDLVHQLDQFGLGHLPFGRPGLLAGLPVVEP